MKIFVSYTTKDDEITIDILRHISHKLNLIGCVYIDILNNDSKNKQKRVFNELDNSDIVILIISSQTHMSEWVRKEIHRATSLLIPIVRLSIAEITSDSIDILKRKIGNANS